MKLALKELWYNKRKYLLIELVIILLMFMVLFLSGMTNGLGRAVSAGIEQMDANYFLVSDSSEDLITVSVLDESVLEKIQQQTSSKVASLDIQRMYLSSEKMEEKLNVTYFAIPAGSFLEPKVYEGSDLSGSKVENPIVLDDDFEYKNIEIGDVVTDSSTGMEFTVVGFSKDQMYGHTSIGFITSESYTVLRQSLNPYYQKEVHSVVVQSDDVDQISIEGAHLATKNEIIEKIPSYQAEHLTLTMIVWVLVVISAVILGVFNYILTMQKEKQFGVMKAIGMKNAKIAGAIVWQVFIISVIGAIVANILNFAIAAALPQTMPYYLAVSSACIDSFAFVAISVISSLQSIIRVSKVDPIIVIGGNE